MKRSSEIEAGGCYKKISLNIEEATLCVIPHLSEYLDGTHGSKYVNDVIAASGGARYTKILNERDVVIGDIKRGDPGKTNVKCYLRAGPRATCFFKPEDCKMVLSHTFYVRHLIVLSHVLR